MLGGYFMVKLNDVLREIDKMSLEEKEYILEVINKKITESREKDSHKNKEHTESKN